MSAMAVARFFVPGLRLTVADPMFGVVHGVALDVGPQALMVTVPVGAPYLALPVSVTVLPTETLALPTADFMVGVAAFFALAALTSAVAPTTRATSKGTVMRWKTCRRMDLSPHVVRAHRRISGRIRRRDMMSRIQRTYPV